MHACREVAAPRIIQQIYCLFTALTDIFLEKMTSRNRLQHLGCNIGFSGKPHSKLQSGLSPWCLLTLLKIYNPNSYVDTSIKYHLRNQKYPKPPLGLAYNIEVLQEICVHLYCYMWALPDYTGTTESRACI